ncbi:hypothetical protein ANCCAN_14647 [Ancylostoma caninum]|uniref:Nucleotide-diphospho-sugar transferase domain-containing protein n=1 Tax=Ancylostoma caninum TaxID=29170 RepID=A0A368G4R8_ANCCA|nr:hypothetical protein ANCCAN_14647 [Ancylostoma caninum]
MQAHMRKQCALYPLIVLSLLFYNGFMVFLYPMKESSRSYRVAIVTVASEDKIQNYEQALLSMKCYAQSQSYDLLIFNNSHFVNECRQDHILFRRHCMVVQVLGNYDYVLLVDSDIMVVNPQKRIEEFIDPSADIIFYDRFYNWEVAIGSYIVKNTSWSRQFLQGYSVGTRHMANKQFVEQGRLGMADPGGVWYSPFAGPIDLSRCTPGDMFNTSKFKVFKRLACAFSMPSLLFDLHTTLLPGVISVMHATCVFQCGYYGLPPTAAVDCYQWLATMRRAGIDRAQPPRDRTQPYAAAILDPNKNVTG